MIDEFLLKVKNAIDLIDKEDILEAVNILSDLKGRLFVIGSGGGAGHASHAVCDFRKLCNIEAYAVYDNVSELTARTNDEGYETSISEWLKVSKLNSNDCLLIFSVGGGATGVSENINLALKEAKEKDAFIIGIVGRNGGNTKRLADACITIKTNKFTTPITEGLQAVIWHLLVTILQKNKTVW
jgi:D-sedoheptulose 7-phosphate isomerase